MTILLILALLAAWLLLTFMLWASSAHFDRSLLPHCFLASTLVTALGGLSFALLRLVS